MNLRPIAFLDSGLGGFPYYEAALDALGDRRAVYYADTANFPYGERTTEDLRRIVSDAVTRILDLWNPSLIVLACNTASVVALETLRARFAVPFIGVVPAIKPAAERYGTGPIGLLATRRTVADGYVSDLIRTYAPDSDVVMVAAAGLIDLIEHEGADVERSILNQALLEPVQRLIDARTRCVVLGCTHFLHVRGHIQSMLGDDIALIDSVDGVVRQIRRVSAGDPGEAPDAAPDSPHRTLYLSGGVLRPAYERLMVKHGMVLYGAGA